jgi:hypothetical protein
LIADALVFEGFAVRHLLHRPPGVTHRISAASLATMRPPWSGPRGGQRNQDARA